MTLLGQAKSLQSIKIMILTRSSDHPRVPAGYKIPPFPSILWPSGDDHGQQYLYYKYDIWRFTMNWTLIMFGAFHLAASNYAVLMHLVARRSWTFGSNTSAKHKRVAGSWLVWLVPLVYVIVAVVEAIIAGSIVGLM
jgi:hypothetical protein